MNAIAIHVARELAVNAPVDEIIDAEIIDDTCWAGYDGCTGIGTLVQDPYENDVNNTPGQLIVACPNCLQEMSDDI